MTIRAGRFWPIPATSMCCVARRRARMDHSCKGWPTAWATWEWLAASRPRPMPLRPPAPSLHEHPHEHEPPDSPRAQVA